MSEISLTERVAAASAELTVEEASVAHTCSARREDPCSCAVFDVRGQLHGTTEIRTIIGADGQRAFVLLLRFIPADPAVYNDFVSTLDEAVQRAERMK